MSVALQDQGHAAPFHALDPHLSLIAVQAAIELDNLLTGTPTELKAVSQLASRLRNSAEEVDGSDVKRNLMDPQTIQILSQACSEVPGEPIKTVDDLAQKAWRLAGDLAEAQKESPRLQVEQLRDFCVSLSRIVSAYRKSLLEDGTPGVPFRR